MTDDQAAATMKTDFERFCEAYPQYLSTKYLDELREYDFDEAEKTGEVYLDYTGGGRYGRSQLKAHTEALQRKVFGNPHSSNPSSRRSTELMERARAAVLEFFNAPTDEYDVIFTPNASGALKLLGESYPFESGGTFLQLADNHNSVNGIREYAKARGADYRIIPVHKPELRAKTAEVKEALAVHTQAPHLFAYPAQSNFSGVQHPLGWIEFAHDEGWDVVLDAAAFAPTNRLDLGKWRPDFVSLSFYKMFGWPTGVGCLLARKSALAKLRRPWFAGGTIAAVGLGGDWHVLAPEHEAFEDGTVNYLNLPAIPIGLDYLKRADIQAVHTRVRCLTGHLLERLSMMKHANGQPMFAIYGPTNAILRGGTIACNFLSPDGKIVDERLVETVAFKHGLSIRAGCFCNPGAAESTFDVRPIDSVEEFVRPNGAELDYDNLLHALGLESGGAIRVSFGLVSNFADAQAFLKFAEEFRDQVPDVGHLPARGHC